MPCRSALADSSDLADRHAAELEALRVQLAAELLREEEKWRDEVTTKNDEILRLKELLEEAGGVIEAKSITVEKCEGEVASLKGVVSEKDVDIEVHCAVSLQCDVL